jgi:hypothetical protein
MTEPAITREAAEVLIERGNDNRVTKEAILAKIVGFEYEIKGTTTHAFLTIDNGFVIHGEAGCVDPANFNAEVGQRLAYDNAFNKLWPLMGFALAERNLLSQ